MITYMIFYIFMNLGIFACIVLFSLHTKTNNIQDYIGLYMKEFLALCLLSLEGLPPLASFFKKTLFILTMSVFFIYYYLKIIRLLINRQN
ncbi:hypothetical protein NC651_039980 [Populus alba x Populus x berolinensis]|nr:hypothetical protein NC651_039980 [Populus alba x Populus x berolinensis]